MVYGYIRVSTDTQTVENQRFEINNYCSRREIEIDGWIEETISGTKNPDKRKLGKLLKKIQKGDTIICSEFSRLGRSMFMIMDILSLCMEKECKVITIKDNFTLGDDIQSKVLAFAFSLAAEIERNLISQRTKEALKLRKAKGVQLGRPKGALSEHTKLAEEEEMIKHLVMKKNTTYAEIAKLFGVNRSTVKRFCDKRGYIRPSVVKKINAKPKKNAKMRKKIPNKNYILRVQVF